MADVLQTRQPRAYSWAILRPRRTDRHSEQLNIITHNSMMESNQQFDLLKTELEIIQRQIDKYDQLSMTIKAWSVTLWAASIGWSFQVKRPEIILVAIFIVLAFWVLDAVNKNFREDYKKRRTEISNTFHNLASGSLSSSEIITPKFPIHKWSEVMRQFFQPYIFVLYVSLVLIGVAIYLLN